MIMVWFGYSMVCFRMVTVWLLAICKLGSQENWRCVRERKKVVTMVNTSKHEYTHAYIIYIYKVHDVCVCILWLRVAGYVMCI